MAIAPTQSLPDSEPVLLRVTDLVIVTDTPSGEVTLVDGVSFEVRTGEVLCIVGESGSGKSLTMLAVMGLLPVGLRVTRGSIQWRGRELLGLRDRAMRAIRGKEIGMIFQDPMTSLNPLRRVGNQLAEAVRLHNKVDRKQALARVHALLRRVGVPQPETRARAYPHQWSGGMRQRAIIAMAMANDPDLLIADEPTTALDVTIQAQVMSTLEAAREELGSALVLITHDLGLAAENASRMLIMYSGRIVESGDVVEVFERPTHPYTQGLLASLLREDSERAYAIPGNPPSPRNRPNGCAFEPRCEVARGRASCSEVRPMLTDRDNGVRSACHFASGPIPIEIGIRPSSATIEEKV
ncbi:ABC transporter ATP-binding protein [Microterricola viridarii]|uniref:Peptide/nickel transport system ATP-binding protein n=1 Tax=Microterricola viridarii TaxID=412690 RepID=A0A1H1ZHK4_9MICO|nr:ABC transporter ATP-binding protein [Microterricola viridarii]SDT33037.1 peptide/nickel transport system ATP-binding protein [Microterricola viridarii]